MTTQSRLDEVAAVDAFLAEAKTLYGPIPPWGNGAWGGEYVATWIVLDSLGAPAAQLRFGAKKADSSVTSANLIYRSRPVWRIDMDPATECHANPPDGFLYSLPPRVCGPHEHAWPINRQHVLGQDQWWLPYRRPLNANVRRLGQALLWLAGEINLTITPEQRGFDGPTRSDLFDRGDQ